MKITKKKIVALLLVGAGAYAAYSFNTGKSIAEEKSYVIGAVERGTIINSVTGTGQVAAYDGGDIKPSVSGKLTYLNIKEGDMVKKGQLIAMIDMSDAKKAVSDAETSLESAKLSLEKIRRGMSPEELELSQMSIDSTKKSITDYEKDLEILKEDNNYNLKVTTEKAEKDLDTAYDNLINEIRTATNKAVDTLYLITDIQYAHFNDNTQEGIKIASAKAGIAKDLLGLDDGGRANVNTLDKSVGGLRKEVSSLHDSKDREDANHLYSSMRNMLKRLNSVLDAVPVNEILTASEKTSVLSRKDELNSEVISLDSKKQSIIDQIKTNEDSIESITRKSEESVRAAIKKIDDTKDSLTDSEKQLQLKNIIDPYDIETQEINIRQKEIALAEAKEKLADYQVFAPFAGIVSTVSVKKGDSVSSGTAIASIMTKEQVAEISLNEVDVAKVKNGQKATLSFDALDELTIVGEVVEIALTGTVSQGVVSYPVKVMLLDLDERVKIGMSVSASIISSSKQDVVMVPSSAIKTASGMSYIECPPDGLEVTSGASLVLQETTQKKVSLGESDGSYTEILSGLEEGDMIITRTITSTTKTINNNQGQSLFQFGGGMPGGRMTR